MGWAIKLTTGIAFFATLNGCVQNRYLGRNPDAGVTAANYTENYIGYFYISSTSPGKNNRFAGMAVKEFSKGGTSGGVCCFSSARPGEDIGVEWDTGQRRDPESSWVRHYAVTRAIGSTSDKPDSNVSLIIRFFPDELVEAEYVVQDQSPESVRNPRFDELFKGRRVMRNMGE